MDRKEETKKGIAEARARGVAWGRHGGVLAARNREQARVFAESLRPLLFDLMVNGRRSATALATELNKRGVPARNGGRWHPATVHRLRKRLEPSLSEEVKQAAKEAAIVKEKELRAQLGLSEPSP